MPSLDLRQETKGFTWGTFWITLSAVLHIAIVVCLVFFTPLRDWFLTPADPADALAGQLDHPVHAGECGQVQFARWG